MEPDYIQLPPMPPDMPAEVIEIIWGFARMKEPERKEILDIIQESMKPGTDNGEKEKLLKMMQEPGGEARPYIKEFYSLMQNLIGTVAAQACEMAALVLQYYCIEEKSTKEISETLHVPEDTIELMAQYYESKILPCFQNWRDHPFCSMGILLGSAFPKPCFSPARRTRTTAYCLLTICELFNILPKKL